MSADAFNTLVQSLAQCDWCLRETPIDKLSPVTLSTHKGVDSEPDDQEPQSNPLVSANPRSYGQSCKDCMDAGFYKRPPAFWMAEEHKRKERAERSVRRILG